MGEDFLLVLVFLIAEEITCKCPRSILRFHRIHCIITRRGKEKNRMLIDTIALVLTIIGAINWLLVGVFQFDIVAAGRDSQPHPIYHHRRGRRLVHHAAVQEQ